MRAIFVTYLLTNVFALFLAALAGQAPAGWHDSGRPRAATSAEG